MKIVDIPNTWAIALFLIKDKGYRICVIRENNKVSSYKATKDGNEFFGTDPVALLGVISIGEKYGEKWRKLATGNLYSGVIEIEVENIKTALGYEPEFEYSKSLSNINEKQNYADNSWGDKIWKK